MKTSCLMMSAILQMKEPHPAVQYQTCCPDAGQKWTIDCIGYGKPISVTAFSASTAGCARRWSRQILITTILMVPQFECSQGSFYLTSFSLTDERIIVDWAGRRRIVAWISVLMSFGGDTRTTATILIN